MHVMLSGGGGGGGGGRTPLASSRNFYFFMKCKCTYMCMPLYVALLHVSVYSARVDYHKHLGTRLDPPLPLM